MKTRISSAISAIPPWNGQQQSFCGDGGGVFNFYRSFSNFSRRQINDIFLSFIRIYVLLFHVNGLQTVCMKYKSLFTLKNEISRWRKLNFVPSMLTVTLVSFVFDLIIPSKVVHVPYV